MGIQRVREVPEEVLDYGPEIIECEDIVHDVRLEIVSDSCDLFSTTPGPSAVAQALFDVRLGQSAPHAATREYATVSAMVNQCWV